MKGRGPPLPPHPERYDRDSTVPADRVPRPDRPDRSDRPDRPTRPCIYCGSLEHFRTACPRAKAADQYVCFNCGIQGHMVGKCTEKFDKKVVDENYKRFLRSLHQKTDFEPVQSKKDISVKIFTKSGDDWQSSSVADLTRDIPLPTTMQTTKNVITLNFTTTADAQRAFQSLKAQGLQLETSTDLTVAVPGPRVPEDTSRLETLERAVSELQKNSQQTTTLLQHMAQQMGLLPAPSAPSTQPALQDVTMSPVPSTGSVRSLDSPSPALDTPAKKQCLE